MNECKKNILLIFGYLLIIALLIVPYSSFSLDLVKGTSVKVPEPPEGFVLDNPNPRQSQSFHDFVQEKIKKGEITQGMSMRDFMEKYKMIKTTQKPKWYVSHERGWIFSPYLLVSKKHFSIDENILTTEIAVILLAAGLSYILFCVVLKKGNK